MKIKNIIFFILSIFSLAILTRCQKEEPINTLSWQEEYSKEGNLLIFKNPQELSSKRITFVNKLVPIVNDRDNLTLKSTNESPEIDITKNYAFKLMAEVASPVYEDNTLQASHVTIMDNYAFVTYNTKGNVWQGAVEIFDVSDLSNPSLISSAILPNADVSSVDYFNNAIYIVGATGDYEALGNISPAYLEVINLSSDMEIISVDTMIDIPSYVGTDIKVTAEKIMCTSGSTGSLIVLDFDYNFVKNIDVSDARSLDVNNDDIFVLQGQEGNIQQFNIATLDLLSNIKLDNSNSPGPKSEIAVNESYIFAAMNEGGLSVLNMDGTMKQHIPRPETPEGGLDENNVTNSVSLNDELVLIGNGESGVHVAGIVEELNDSIWMLGSMQFEGYASTNFVESKDSVIFVATGLEGLKILSISVDDGVPDDITKIEPCSSLMGEISKFFPETVDVRNTLTNLFNDTAHLNIYIEEETELFATFIHEGAGWKNTFGYYSYPAENPPSDISQIEHHIIFPNVSKEGDGGGLNYGDLVQIGNSKFTKGTIVGFYIVAQGWKNGMTVDGRYTLYSDKRFNTNNFQQSTLFVNDECKDLVLTFEDILQNDPNTKCDFDYNDIIIVLKDNPNANVENTRIRYSNLPNK